jgi:hypothetical protein
VIAGWEQTVWSRGLSSSLQHVARFLGTEAQGRACQPLPKLRDISKHGEPYELSVEPEAAKMPEQLKQQRDHMPVRPVRAR